MTLSLGGGQGNGTTDPSADSDLKGHEVGTRSAEPPRHPLSRLRDKPEIPKLSLAHPNFSKHSMAGSISQDWRPCPVCLIDRTRVLFRFSESQQTSLYLGTEAEAVFRMLKRPKRDVFEFSDSRQVTLGDLPAGLIFDVLVVPGSEQLSTLLEMEPVVQHGEEEKEKEKEKEKEPLLTRLMAHF